MPTQTKTPRAVKAATTQEKPAAAPRPDLTGIPAQIADFVGDMLVNGAYMGNLRLLIYACLDHQYRTFEFTRDQDAASLTENAENWTAKYSDEWSDALANFRHGRKRIPEPERPMTDTASARIRETAKQTLRDQFSSFADTASPEDARLMISILEDWDSQRAVWGNEPAMESALASGFECALNSNKSYVRVPGHLADHITAYANALANATSVPAVKAV